MNTIKMFLIMVLTCTVLGCSVLYIEVKNVSGETIEYEGFMIKANKSVMMTFEEVGEMQKEHNVVFNNSKYLIKKNTGTLIINIGIEEEE